MKKILAVGGSSSGKSEWAEEQATVWERSCGKQVVYVATAQVCDEEFARRVQRHQQRRPDGWGLVEAPHELASVFARHTGGGAILLVDSMGAWLANRMWQDGQASGWSPEQQTQLHLDIEQLCDAIGAYRGACLLVADEVGMGVVPDNEMGRLFRDLNGLLNRSLAGVADEAYLVSCGIPLKLK